MYLDLKRHETSEARELLQIVQVKLKNILKKLEKIRHFKIPNRKYLLEITQ